MASSTLVIVPFSSSCRSGLFLRHCTLVACFVVVQYWRYWTIFSFNPRNARGWTSIIFVILLLAAVNLICMGILAEYMGRLFEEVKHRPNWIVKERINLPPPNILWVDP